MTSPATTFSGPDLCKLPAREAVDLLKAKKVSPKELLDASYECIAQVEPDVNATGQAQTSHDIYLAMRYACWDSADWAAAGRGGCVTGRIGD